MIIFYAWSLTEVIVTLGVLLFLGLLVYLISWERAEEKHNAEIKERVRKGDSPRDNLEVLEFSYYKKLRKKNT